MKPSTDITGPNSESKGSPYLRRINRRDFLQLTRGTVLWVGAVTGAGYAIAGQLAAEGRLAPSNRFPMPAKPIQNPGFQARSAPDENVVVWTHRATSGAETTLVAYCLNRYARQVWQLCDGTRDELGIETDYRTQTGRPEEEAKRVLLELKSLGIIVCGGFAVADTGFPTLPPGYLYTSGLRKVEGGTGTEK